MLLVHTEHPSSSLASQQERAPGQAVGKALQKDFERNVLVRCRSPPSPAWGHGDSTRSAEGTNIPEGQGWEVSLPRSCVGSSVEGVRGAGQPGRAAEGCREAQHAATSAPFPSPHGNCSPAPFGTNAGSGHAFGGHGIW